MPDWFSNIFNDLLKRFQAASLPLRFVIIFGLVLLCFLGVRFGYFGDPAREFSFRIIDNIRWIDAPKTKLVTALNFEVTQAEQTARGKAGETYFPGDEISLSIKLNKDIWLIVFGIDSEGIHPVFPDHKRLVPGFVSADTGDYKTTFELNETVGEEIYFLVGNETEFTFGDIKNAVDKIDRNDLARGPKFTWTLNLADAYAQSSIQFRNAGKP